MWTKGWRDEIWSQLDRPWDLVIIGGGITGAGILNEASRMGLRALLLEGHDFGAGTSSRSSKLVHGGLRYLKNAQFKVTWECVRERQRLLHQGQGLIEHLPFTFLSMKGDSTPGWVFGLGLVAYDLMAWQWNHQHYSAETVRHNFPVLTNPALLGGYRYYDAQTDDARLTLRVIREAVRAGGCALNYARAVQLLRSADGSVRAVAVRDEDPAGGGRTYEVQAKAVVNATGAWADELRQQIDRPRRLRALRGSHLVFSAERLPLKEAISILHPADSRPVFVFPWEGVTLVGTTDVDPARSCSPAARGNPASDLCIDPAISASEAEYLLEFVRCAFPALELGAQDVLSTFAGFRTVVDTGKADPSKESREQVIWHEDCLLTVTGGKLTAFRLMARQALETLCKCMPEAVKTEACARAGAKPTTKGIGDRILDPLPELAMWAGARPAPTLRLLGRCGADTPALLEAAGVDELDNIGGTLSTWAELRWAARAEGVVHLDDLLLRRVRLGLLLPNGGVEFLPRIRTIVQPELGWDDARWQQEEQTYRQLWQRSYSLEGMQRPA